MRHVAVLAAIVIVAGVLLSGAAAAQQSKPAAAAKAAPAKPVPAPVAAPSPTPEQQVQIAELKGEIERIEREVSDAKAQDEKYTGGLIKAQIGMRIEILRTSIALLQHRVAALQSGAKFVPPEVPATQPDQAMIADLEREIANQKEKITANRAQQERYSGGLIVAQMKSTEATMNETLALLERRLLTAKYGLTPIAVTNLARTSGQAATGSAATTAEKKEVSPALADTILTVNLLSKRRIKQKYDEMIILDMDVTASGLDKPARAIKGVLKVTDLFGEPRMNINWDFDSPVAPGGVLQERDKGVNYNQFNDRSRWLDSTEQQNMKVIFTVKSILYEDGTRRDF